MIISVLNYFLFLVCLCFCRFYLKEFRGSRRWLLFLEGEYFKVQLVNSVITVSYRPPLWEQKKKKRSNSLVLVLGF